MDFTATMGPELAQAFAAEREQRIHDRRWNRYLDELKDGGSREPKNVRLFRGKNVTRRRRALFVEGLEAAQREGITVDAWFGYRFADPELSARAEWAGLVEHGRNEKDAWAA